MSDYFIDTLYLTPGEYTFTMLFDYQLNALQGSGGTATSNATLDLQNPLGHDVLRVTTSTPEVGQYNQMPWISAGLETDTGTYDVLTAGPYYLIGTLNATLGPGRNLGQSECPDLGRLFHHRIGVQLLRYARTRDVDAGGRGPAGGISARQAATGLTSIRPVSRGAG
jgi:hypothetical protein